MSGQIMKVYFKLHKGKPNKLGRVPIMAQWKIGGVLKSLSTKLNVLPERWTFERTLGLTKDDKMINAELDRIRMAIMDKFHEMLQCGEIVTAEKLKCAVSGNGYSDHPRSFVEVFDLWLEERGGGIVGEKSSGKVRRFSFWAIQVRRLAFGRLRSVRR